VDVALLLLAGSAALIVAAWVAFGEVGLVAGLAVLGVCCYLLANARAKVRAGRGSA